MWANTPDIKVPTQNERNKTLINCLTTKLIREIENLCSAAWIWQKEIQINLYKLLRVSPREIVTSLNELIDENFWWLQLGERTEKAKNLIMLFELSCQEIQIEWYKSDMELSPDEEVTSVETSIAEILGIEA